MTRSFEKLFLSFPLFYDIGSDPYDVAFTEGLDS